MASKQTFTIRDIPYVMRKEYDFEVAAAFMDQWFELSAYEFTGDERSGDGVDFVNLQAHRMNGRAISASWVRSRAKRADKAYWTLINTWSTWSMSKMLALQSKGMSPAGGDRYKLSANQACKRVRTWIAKNNLPKGAEFRFGDLSKPAHVLHGTCQANFQQFASSIKKIFPPDELFCAMGVGSWQLAVSGMVAPISNEMFRLTIDEIGLYAFDTYDFEYTGKDNYQRLGNWGWDGIGYIPWWRELAWDKIPIRPQDVDPTDELDTEYWVDNDSFREYRKWKLRGGDFYIFSSVDRIKLTQPVVITGNYK